MTNLTLAALMYTRCNQSDSPSEVSSVRSRTEPGGFMFLERLRADWRKRARPNQYMVFERLLLADDGCPIRSQ